MDLAKIVKELLKDSEMFVGLAKTEKNEGNTRLEKTYSRAAIFTSWSAFEGWVNYVCSDFSRLGPDRINIVERAFLEEKKIELDDDGIFQITTRSDFQPTSTKICFLLNRFGNFPLRTTIPKLWNDFRNIENIRNTLVHPSFEKQEISVDSKTADKALRVTREITFLLKNKIYRKS